MGRACFSRQRHQYRFVHETVNNMLIASDGWCAECGCAVRTAAPGVLATALAMPLVEVYALLDAGDIHAAETPDGQLQICLKSLPPAFGAVVHLEGGRVIR